MSELRVIVDATAIRLGGGMSYVTRQLGGVERVAPDLDLTVVAAPWNEAALRDALSAEIVQSGVHGMVGRLLYEQERLPRKVADGTVLHCPANLAPILPGRRPATVVTIQNPNLFGVGRALPHNHAWYRRLRIYGARRSVELATRVIAVSEAMMAQVRADVPTLGEQGFGSELNGFLGLFGTAGTPEPVVRALNAEVLRIMSGDEARQRLATMNVATFPANTPAQFAQTLAADLQAWRRIVVENEIRP